MTTLSLHQEEALKTVVDSIRDGNPLTYLAGYAGTGKSTLLPFILSDLGYQPNRVWFCAPTGKAAKVMRAKLRDQQYPNSNATTIHSVIYRAKQAPTAMLESNIADNKQKLAAVINAETEAAAAEGRVPSMSKHPEIGRLRGMIERLEKELMAIYREDEMIFHINPDSPIQQCDLVVVDEASMVGKIMAADLMSFGIPVFAMGDPGQLPPVMDDVGLTRDDPDFFLTEIHRQAAGNPIIWLSMLAREGKDLPLGKHGEEVEVIERRKFQHIYNDFLTRPQFLSGTHKTRWKTNQKLRQDFGFVNMAGDIVGPQVGEPLVIRKNVKDYPSLVNGTGCIARTAADLVPGQAMFDLEFDDDEGNFFQHHRVYQGLFEENFSKRKDGYTASERLAYQARRVSVIMDWDYCRTVHSSQGGQWDDVVLVDESSCFREDANKHLYTGITRAAKTLKVLV